MKKIMFLLICLVALSATINAQPLPATVGYDVSSYRLSGNGYEWVVTVSIYILDEYGVDMASGAEGYQVDWYSNGFLGYGPLQLAISNGPWIVDTWDGSLPGNSGVQEYDIEIVYRNPSTGHSISSGTIHLSYIQP